MVPDTGHPIDQQATPAHRHADASCSRRTKVIPFSLRPQSVWVGTKCQGICDRQSYSVLFEAGVDVAMGVALTKVRWNADMADYYKRDKVEVFVSIVSTKISRKGTSKEYTGDDATDIHKSVKRAMQNSCPLSTMANTADAEKRA